MEHLPGTSCTVLYMADTSSTEHLYESVDKDTDRPFFYSKPSEAGAVAASQQQRNGGVRLACLLHQCV